VPLKIKSIQAAALTITLTGGVIATVGLLTGRYVVTSIAGIIILYLVTSYVIRRYVVYRIKPICQIVGKRDSSLDDIEKSYRDKDIVTEISSELSEWANESSTEITKLKENEVFRREFVGNVLHELKTPIFCIQGYALTLLDGGLEDPKINRKYILLTEKNINRLINVVEDLETISKLETESIFLETQRFDITLLAQEMIDSLSMRAEDKNITMTIDSYSDTGIFVIAERKRIGQVLTNLITNAIKYGKQDGKVTIHFMDMSERIMVEVQDNGVGIPPEHLYRIFERFYRVDKSRSREEGGTGLGLAISRHIIESHRQTITVRSTLDVGTTFSFTLQKG